VPPDLVIDTNGRFRVAPTGDPAKLLALLAGRFAFSPRRVVVLPTELVSRTATP
jgi:hypothetical protein